MTTAVRSSQPSRITRFWRAFGDFVRRVYKKAEQDNIFFLAGAIAFNVLVAIIPLALTAVGVAGFFLQARSDLADPSEPVVNYLLQALPTVSEDFRLRLKELLDTIIGQATGLFTIGTLVFAWLATRLIGTLRTVLREIFDIDQERSIIAGKIFDLQMVFVTGTLLAANIAITTTTLIYARRGFDYINLPRMEESFALGLIIPRLLSFLTIWSMFVLIYRYLPIRRIHWRTAVIAATFTAVTFELMKIAFGWYFANHANYSTYGSISFLAVVIIWVYYAAIAFIIGGEVGQVASLKRIRKQQKERLN